ARNCGDPAARPETNLEFRSAAEYPEPTAWACWRCRRYQPATLAETYKLESAAGLLAVSPAVASDLVVGVVTGLGPEQRTHLSPLRKLTSRRFDTDYAFIPLGNHYRI